MELFDKVVVITGAAGGIGAACADRFAREAPRRIVCADLDAGAAARVAAQVNDEVGRDVAYGRRCDVGVEASVRALIDDVTDADGVVDLYLANAGVAQRSDPLTDDDVWDRAWRVNTMAHVWAARHLLPGWLARGEGYLVTTASVAGLLTGLGDAAYTATKHAAVGFAEWLAITYRDDGVRVAVVCPAAVDTPLLSAVAGDDPVTAASLSGAGVIGPDAAAAGILQGIRDDATLILTHDVTTFLERRLSDHRRWISGMARQWGTVRDAFEAPT